MTRELFAALGGSEQAATVAQLAGAVGQPAIDEQVGDAGLPVRAFGGGEVGRIQRAGIDDDVGLQSDELF